MTVSQMQKFPKATCSAQDLLDTATNLQAQAEAIRLYDPAGAFNLLQMAYDHIEMAELLDAREKGQIH